MWGGARGKKYEFYASLAAAVSSKPAEWAFAIVHNIAGLALGS